jgi:hypothetical protein
MLFFSLWNGAFRSRARRPARSSTASRIYDLGATENGLDLSNALIDSLAEDGDPVVHVVKTRQSIDFSLVLTELAYRLLHSLEGAAQTLAAISDDPLLVARELINGSAAARPS